MAHEQQFKSSMTDTYTYGIHFLSDLKPRSYLRKTQHPILGKLGTVSPVLLYPNSQLSESLQSVRRDS